MTIILILSSLFLMINHILLVKALRELLEVWDGSVTGIKALSLHLCGVLLQTLAHTTMSCFLAHTLGHSESTLMTVNA
jgi:hypothetical protein